MHILSSLTALHLRFSARLRQNAILTSAPGATLRGALYHALGRLFDDDPMVAWLLSMEVQLPGRGSTPTRPITVEPPLKTYLRRDEPLCWGFTLIGPQAIALAPYIILAVREMGRIGIGKGNARFDLERVSEYSPLLDAERPLVARGIDAPRNSTMTITQADICQAAARLRRSSVVLDFFTPVEIYDKGAKLTRFEAAPFAHRLVERVQMLASIYCDDATPLERWKALALDARCLAETWRVGYDDTSWRPARSHSDRTDQYQSLSGMIGRVRLEGEIGPLLPLLLWGQSVHVGKATVKGNGWYALT